MNDLSFKFYELSVTCGMNQRYHQYEMTLWWWIYMIMIIPMVISAVITVVNWDTPTLFWKCSITIFALSILSWAFTLYNFTFYKNMFHDWSRLRQDVDIIKIEVEHDTRTLTPEIESEHRGKYNDLWKQKNTLNMLEPAPKEWLLQKSFENELRSRGVEEKDIP